MRDKVELEAEKQGWREELIESVVKQEMQEEAVRLVSGKRGTIALQSSVHKWHRYRSRQLERRRKVVFLCSKRGQTNGYVVWRNYIKECKRWDPGRYVRLRNERQLQLQALMYTYKSFYGAWLNRQKF
jgi:hypothetical protein